MAGTNYFIPKTSTVDVALTDASDNATLVRCTVANIPSAQAGYAIGCNLQATDTGRAYVNTGTATSSTFTLLEDAGGALTLPTTATDAVTATTNSLDIITSAITTGKGESVQADALTTGSAIFAGSASTDSSTRGVVTVSNTGAGSTGAVLLNLNQSIVVSTNFRKIIRVPNTGITIWMGNGNTGNNALSGTAGDLLVNGGSNKPEYCTGTTGWTALV